MSLLTSDSMFRKHRGIALMGVAFLWLSIHLSCQTTMSMEKKPNQLIHESSPYLLQHAFNPVDWHPWNTEVLEKAKNENKLIIISIGYAACHWCHVMEHESFEDSTVAAIMNRHFISIKVDREERPDVDDVYMTACQLASGQSCGWPLNAFALPDGRPIWAGTYSPKKQWIQVLEYFIKTQEKEYEKLVQYADKLQNGILEYGDIEVIQTDSANIQWQDKLNQLITGIAPLLDQKLGGTKGAPKFPMPNQLIMAAEIGTSFHNSDLVDHFILTLDRMAAGGIYDQLAGGFARYSTDATWTVPHFEKMLYDNAQLIYAYSLGHQLTQKTRYRDIVYETIEFLQRELMDETGVFYSSLDADSEGEEGKYYIWKLSEVEETLSDPNELDLIIDLYGLTKQGNWENGYNILYENTTLSEWSEKNQISVEKATSIRKSAFEKMSKVRSKRERPGLDDKALTAWNALLIQGLAKAYQAFEEPDFIQLAERLASFYMKGATQTDYRLYRSFKAGKSSINAFLDDYALLSQALIAMYEVTFDESYLIHADRLVEYTRDHFWDSQNGGFFYTSDLDDPLIARKKIWTDNVIPGSNSVMGKNLQMLDHYFDRPQYREMYQSMLNGVLNQLEQQEGIYYSNWLRILHWEVAPPKEVVVIGKDWQSKTRELMKSFWPSVVWMGGPAETELPLLQSKAVEGETLIYVCENKVCKFPVSEVSEALSLLKE